MHEEFLTGIEYLGAATTLSQRVRASHPTAGLLEAADFQWWWRTPRSTDTHPQLFWFDEGGRPVAAVIATDWKDGVSLDPVVLPETPVERISAIMDRGFAHAKAFGLGPVDVAIDRTDAVMKELLAAHGFTEMEDEVVESWLRANDRPDTSPLASGYRLARRADTGHVPHHMIGRSGPDVEKRLRQTSLYRDDLDLVIFDQSETVAAYGLFWFDPTTGTGLVEPMRTEEAHQQRGLARHVLTAGIAALAEAGATRIKICYEPDNPAAKHLYLSVGFEPHRLCARVSEPG